MAQEVGKFYVARGTKFRVAILLRIAYIFWKLKTEHRAKTATIRELNSVVLLKNYYNDI